jgi:serine/threonine protein kinase
MSDAKQTGETAVGATVLASSDGEVLRSTPALGDDPRIGTLLKDTYRVLGKLGAGGMGTVYLAEHSAIRKKVAIKVLATAFVQRPELAERFLREARAAAAIASEHVIEIHDFGTTPDGAAFFVMEHLQGEDLGHLLAREGPLPWPRVRTIVLQVCTALQAAHERGIFHRDMKPDNCYRLDRADGSDFIKVLDFGIAKVLSDEADGGKGLTQTGMIFGTPDYMSPEQAQGVPHDHRVDIYATGVIMFQLLTGELPFKADSFMGLLNKHMFEAPPRPSAVNPSVEIAPEVEAIILKALQKDPALRFQSMQAFAAAVTAVGTGAPPVTVVPERLPQPPRPGVPIGFRDIGPGRRRWLVPALAVAALVVGGVALAQLLGDDDVPPPAPAAIEPPPPPPPIVAAPVIAAPPPVEPEREPTKTPRKRAGTELPSIDELPPPVTADPLAPDTVKPDTVKPDTKPDTGGATLPRPPPPETPPVEPPPPDPPPGE